MAGEIDRVASSTAALIATNKRAEAEQARRAQETEAAYAAVTGSKVVGAIPSVARTWVPVKNKVGLELGLGVSCSNGKALGDVSARFERNADTYLAVSYRCGGEKDGYTDQVNAPLWSTKTQVAITPAFIGTVADAVTALTKDLAPYEAGATSTVVIIEKK